MKRKLNKKQQKTKQIKKSIKKSTKKSTKQDMPRSRGIKGMFKGIICLLFGHDWVSYNEHAWICSRCMEVAPKG